MAGKDESSLDPASINKLRRAFGMAEIPFEGDHLTTETPEDEDVFASRDAAAADNWTKHQAEQQERRDRERAKQEKEKKRKQRMAQKVLEGYTYGDAANKSEGAKSWIRGFGARQTNIRIDRDRKAAEEKRKKEQVVDYGAEDLAGVTVGHDMNDFAVGADQILTLADRGVEEEEGDVLESTELAAAEKQREKNELKKKKAPYNPLEAGDEKQGILSQYDEEIEGKRKRKHFILSAQSSLEKKKKEADPMQQQEDLYDLIMSGVKPPKPRSRSASEFREPLEQKVRLKKRSEESKPVEDMPAETTATEGAPPINRDRDRKHERKTKNGGGIVARRRERTRATDEPDETNDDDTPNITRVQVARKRKGLPSEYLGEEEESGPKRTISELRDLGQVEQDELVMDIDDSLPIFLNGDTSQQKQSSSGTNGPVTNGDVDRMDVDRKRQGSTAGQGVEARSSKRRRIFDGDELYDEGLKKIRSVDERTRLDARHLEQRYQSEGLTYEESERRKDRQGEFLWRARERRQQEGLEEDEEERPEEGIITLDSDKTWLGKMDAEEEAAARHETMRRREEREAAEARRLAEEVNGDATADVVITGDEATAMTSAAALWTPTQQGVSSTGMGEEKSLEGVGDTLAMLRERGLVKERNQNLAAEFRRQQMFLESKKRAREEADNRARTQRERDRASGRYSHLSHVQREEQGRKDNERREVEEAVALADKFNREYKPSFKLEYHDEYGRQLSAKEAFKELSHQFHGKGSGKKKTEKHLAKIEKEREMERRAMDTHLREDKLAQQAAAAKVTGKAYTRLG